jgi:hypothetical protein
VPIPRPHLIRIDSSERAFLVKDPHLWYWTVNKKASLPFQPVSCSIHPCHGVSMRRRNERGHRPLDGGAHLLTSARRQVGQLVCSCCRRLAWGTATGSGNGAGLRCLHLSALVRYETWSAISSPSIMHQFLGRSCLIYCGTEESPRRLETSPTICAALNE